MRALYFISIIALFLSFPAFAQNIDGKVIRVADGDTLTVMADDLTKYKIRLAEIDAPEKGQPFGNKAKKILSDLTMGKQVRVERFDTDRYGRIVGKVFVSDESGNFLNVNKTMINSGAAWVYERYMKDRSLLKLQEIARTNKRGLWALSEAEQIKPSLWRQRSQEQLHQDIEKQNKVMRSQQNKGSSFSCGSKRVCKQMSSCAEARYYLENCGLSRLDGDSDGTPCESIC